MTELDTRVAQAPAEPEPPPFDIAETDRLLTTTRSVRRRLDLNRPVPRHLVEEAVRIAIQAPTANNTQNWRWLVVTEQETISRIGELISASWAFHRTEMLTNAGRRRASAQALRNTESAQALAENLGKVPVLVIPCVLGRPPDIGAVDAAWEQFADTKASDDLSHELRMGPMRASVFYGSVFPAIWSFQLALRSRGLGSTISAMHVPHERRIGELLGIPTGVSQICMIPVAYTLGGDFRPARRRAAADVTYWERWES